MPSLRTDQALWYNNGIFGRLGYAVPNFGDDANTLNSSIAYLVDIMGRNLSGIMHHGDADLRTPPSINTLTRIHRLIVRARGIIAGRAVPPNIANFEGMHTSPAPQDFIIYPVPYFRVRNAFMKEYCGLILNAISECCQHTENRNSYEISTGFGGAIGLFLHRVYRRMASELFQIPATETAKLDFTLTDAQIAAYNPYLFFTPTEMIDTVPRTDLVLTEDDSSIVTNGIPASQLISLSRYPSTSVVVEGNDVKTAEDLDLAIQAQRAAMSGNSEEAKAAIAAAVPPTTPYPGSMPTPATSAFIAPVLS